MRVCLLPCLMLLPSLMAGAAYAQSPAASSLPSGARIAFVNLNRIATSSVLGQQATRELQEARSRRAAEITERTRQLEALEQRLKAGPSLLNDEALTSLERDVNRTRVELQRFVQDAQDELRTMEEELQRTFFDKLFPVIDQVATEKDLWAVFTIGDPSLVWYEERLDISGMVAERLDATIPARPPAEP